MVSQGNILLEKALYLLCVIKLIDSKFVDCLHHKKIASCVFPIDVHEQRNKVNGKYKQPKV